MDNFDVLVFSMMYTSIFILLIRISNNNNKNRDETHILNVVHLSCIQTASVNPLI